MMSKGNNIVIRLKEGVMIKNRISLLSMIKLSALLLIGVVLWLVLMGVLFREYQSKQTTYLETEKELFTTEIESILLNYVSFSSYIYETTLNRIPIHELLKRAYYDEKEHLDELRVELYNLISPEYERMLWHSIKELHFHTPDGYSFLKLHQPESFGQTVIQTRSIIRDVQESQSFKWGFEEGLTFNGYRFVYPLRTEGFSLGSVEISLPMSRFIAILNRLYPKNELFFIINRSSVDYLTSTGERSNFLPSSFSDDYLRDYEVASTLNQNKLTLVNSEQQAIMEGIKAKSNEQLSQHESFNFVMHVGNIDYLVQFMKIDNYSGDFIGYLISVSKSPQYNALLRALINQLVLVCALFLLLMLSALKFTRDQLKLVKLSSIDSLTQIQNRYSLQRDLEKEFVSCKRYERPLSILLIDIDYFKRINDAYGHSVGDYIIKEVTSLLVKNLRQQDYIGRWGGEEFLVILPETNLEGACIVAEKCRNIIAVHPFEKDIKMTISIGAAEYKKEVQESESLVQRADEALYNAKNAGRNRIAF